MNRGLFGLISVGGLLVAACSSDESIATTTVEVDVTSPALDTGPDTTPGTVREHATVISVPDDFATIQEAVDAARPGDLILIGAGTYHESVNVETDNLTIRGLDRNEVVLDGTFQLDNGIRVLGANGVSIENMTATNYTKNAFFWTGASGYRGSYLTTYRTGDYGVYAFDSVQGQLDHVLAVGSKDAGIYIGQCYPCDAVVDQIESSYNGLGYSGTNSGGNLLIVNSVFHHNRAGVLPNSGSYELCYPERETTIVGNLVYSNNEATTAAIDIAVLDMGNGILTAGGVRNVIERNLVFDHDKTGIGLIPYVEADPNDDLSTEADWQITCEESKSIAPAAPTGVLVWDSWQSRVIGNVLDNNREADLVVAAIDTDVSTLGHCFSGNTFTTSAPKNLETLAPCDGAGTGDWTDGGYNVQAWLDEERPPSIDYKIAVLPPLEAQPNMPNAATAPANPATNVPMKVDLAAIKVPAKP